MIIGAIIVGILIFALIILGEHISERCSGGFEFGAFTGAFITILCVVEICLILTIIQKSKPSALDVYQNKTTLEITYKDGVPVDSVVVWKGGEK